MWSNISIIWDLFRVFSLKSDQKLHSSCLSIHVPL